jgi:hypothetical protein
MPDPIEKKPNEPVAYVPPSQQSVEEIQKLFVDEPAGEQKSETPAATPAPTTSAEPPKPPEPAKDDLPALLKIAKEKDAVRKAKEEIAPHASMLKRFTPQQLQRLADAAASENPVAALAAMGFTHAQYNAAVAGLKKEQPAPESAPGAPPPEVLTLKQELEAIKAERENEKLQASRQQFLSHTEKLLKDDSKFSHLSALGEWQSVERVILQHIEETGSPPGETLDETIRLAAEVVEHRLKKEAERWQKVLTGFQKPASTPPSKAPESPQTGSETPRTLTNANTSAPAAVRAAPKTRAEILDMIARGEDMSGIEPL